MPLRYNSIYFGLVYTYNVHKNHIQPEKKKISKTASFSGFLALFLLGNRDKTLKLK